MAASSVTAMPWRDDAAWPRQILLQAADAERLRYEPGQGRGRTTAVYHHPDGGAPVTVAAFLPGEDIGRFESAALALQS
jgi:hypothetical protein